MGLDMYLLRKTYVKNWGDEKWQVNVTREGKPTHIDSKRISYIEEEFGYWRKANHIHKWFVDNVQNKVDDCETYYVSRDQLSELAEVCRQVLNDPQTASQLLPTANGFFFGSTEYDEYYMNDVQDTLKICEEALNSPKDNSFSFYYHSSW